MENEKLEWLQEKDLYELGVYMNKLIRKYAPIDKATEQNLEGNYTNDVMYGDVVDSIVTYINYIKKLKDGNK